LFALDQINVSTWLDKLQLPATARQLVNQQIRTRYDEPSRLSLLYFAQQSRVYRGVSDRDLRAARLPGGSPVLAQAFVKQLKTIKTSSPVTAIVQDKDGVTVKVGSVGYQADYLVMAVPLRALAKIQMTPGLDNQHLAALKGTNYGWRDQIMLKFKSPVWESRARMSGEIFSNTGLGMLWIEPALKGGANVVINLSGDNARLLQAFGDKQMVDQVLIRLHAFYPQARGAFTGYEVRATAPTPAWAAPTWPSARPDQQVLAPVGAPGATHHLCRRTHRRPVPGHPGRRPAQWPACGQPGAGPGGGQVVRPGQGGAGRSGGGGAAAAKDKGGFFSNLFGGSSDKAGSEGACQAGRRSKRPSRTNRGSSRVCSVGRQARGQGRAGRQG
jgi:monoamine oxidase